MKKNIQYKFGASLFALAFSLVGADEAWAQTCVPSPSCDTLGFTKTAADCAGKTILKCPFDTSKVYCPGAEEQGDSPFVSTWEVGASVMYNGKEVGLILEDRGASVIVHDQGYRGSFDYLRQLRSQCEGKGSILGYQWVLPNEMTVKELISRIDISSAVFYEHNSNAQDDDHVYYCNKLSEDNITCNDSILNVNAYVFCIMTIPKPL